MNAIADNFRRRSSEKIRQKLNRSGYNIFNRSFLKYMRKKI